MSENENEIMAEINQQKMITDRKVRYLIKTLSRTNKKDYENYVINAIWNRLGRDDIEVVSQQCVRKDGKYYFIDLYFPKLNIGIECDEAYHEDARQKENDKKREDYIYDSLSSINPDASYEPIHIKVNKEYKEVEAQINAAVDRLKSKINEINPPKWEILTPEEYFKGRTEITIEDNIGFKTMAQACNVLFSTGYKGLQPCYLRPRKFHNTVLADCMVWFPKYKLKNSKGFNNVLSPDGMTITTSTTENDIDAIQKTEDKEANEKVVRGITFLQRKDPLGIVEYKFVGIFVNNKRVDTICPMLP